ncbi:MAG: feruloyl esterase [Sphingomonadales bacterium 12-68-11]|nr:MAG: feruloyl esterase [Sphingomonadales bacterium 12-68-11]
MIGQNSRRRTALVAALLAGAVTFPAPGVSQTASAAQRCERMIGTELRPGLTVTAARHLAASAARPAAGPGAPPAPALPAHCRLEGTIDPHKGTDGKDYAIGFALALPDTWNGRFLLQGGGGLNGSVGQPIGPVASGERSALARGFAVISHDSGHKGAGFDDSFMSDQRAALNFAEASVRTVTLDGKALTERFYGRKIDHSYMTGCSTGGREGMLAAQRYPELFDGIVVGAPAMRTGHSNLAIEWAAVQFNQSAPRDAQGLPLVERIFSASDRTAIVGGLLKQCDALDGRADGMVMNVAQCRFRPAELQCRGEKADGCLSGAQVTALERAFAGPKDAAGDPIYVPVPFDTGIAFTGPGLPGYLPTGTPGVFGPATRALTIAIDARLRAVEADAAQRLTDTHVWTDLDTFLGRGGKLLMFHGVSDPWFSAFDSWDWWQRAAATNGASFTEASRYYMIPGMMHCQGGNAFDRFDLLGPLVDWVEQGKAPDRPLASRANGSGAVPLCPHPGYPHYVSGDPAKPESYQCRSPAS